MLGKNFSSATLILASITLSSCGGSGSSSGSSTDSFMTINGQTYAPVASAITVAIQQTSLFNYSLGGPAFTVAMSDGASGNLVNIFTNTTASGLPSVSYLSTSSDTTAMFLEKNGGTSVTYGNYANPATTNGSVTIKTFGEVGQQVTGSFDLNLCQSASCSATVKNFKGEFSATRYPNSGSSASPVTFTTLTTGSQYNNTHRIAPQTGSNHYQITSATSGVATIKITPTTDVDLAVYSDAAFSTPASCDVTSTLSLTGSAAETCAITTTANQKLYFKVSQKPGVTALDSYIINITKQ